VIWTVELDPRARREIAELPDPVKREARHLLEDLHDLPIELADTVLEGHEGLYAARFIAGGIACSTGFRQSNAVCLFSGCDRAKLRTTGWNQTGLDRDSQSVSGDDNFFK
jgi:hypothetical protein